MASTRLFFCSKAEREQCNFLLIGVYSTRLGKARQTLRTHEIDIAREFTVTKRKLGAMAATAVWRNTTGLPYNILRGMSQK